MNNIKHLRGIKFKKAIHPALLKTMSGRCQPDFNVEGRFPLESVCLVVANHYCIKDVPTLAKALEKHFCLLVSDEDKHSIDGLALNLHGVRWIHRTDKNDRHNAEKDIVDTLIQGYDFGMYPGATWCLSPNQLIEPYNYGCIRIALKSKRPILPVSTFFTENGSYTIINNLFYPTSDLEDSVDKLRDIMAANICSIMEMIYKNNPNSMCIDVDGKPYYCESRVDIPDDYWEEEVKKRYMEYKRAAKDVKGVRNFESQFIFTPNTDAHRYFQLFNSVIRLKPDGLGITRISSEKDGHMGKTFGEYSDKDHFGFGYNEEVLFEQLARLEKDIFEANIDRLVSMALQKVAESCLETVKELEGTAALELRM